MAGQALMVGAEWRGTWPGLPGAPGLSAHLPKTPFPSAERAAIGGSLGERAVLRFT